MVDLVTASHDKAVFAKPNELDLGRDVDSYIHYGWGPHKCLGDPMTRVALATMLKVVVGELRGLRRAPGPQGSIREMKQVGGFKMYLTPDGGSFFPFPTGLKVQWDAGLRPGGRKREREEDDAEEEEDDDDDDDGKMSGTRNGDVAMENGESQTGNGALVEVKRAKRAKKANRVNGRAH